MHTDTHIDTHACTPTHRHMYTFTHTQQHPHSRTPSNTHIHAHPATPTFTHTQQHMNAHPHPPTPTHTYMHPTLYIHMHAHPHTTLQSLTLDVRTASPPQWLSFTMLPLLDADLVATGRREVMMEPLQSSKIYLCTARDGYNINMMAEPPNLPLEPARVDERPSLSSPCYLFQSKPTKSIHC